MNMRTLMGSVLIALLVAGSANARDERLKMSIKEAMETAEAQEKLGTEVKFFFGSQKSPKPTSTLGTYTANKKTNFANKSDQAGCQIAFLSAMIALKDRALAEGGNGVINIHSIYKNEKFESDTEYECGAGKIMGGVALRGTVVKL